MTHVPYYFQKAALNFTRSYDDVPSSEYYVNEPAKASRFQEFVDDIGSTIEGHGLRVVKHTNAVFSRHVGNPLTYPALKATCFGVYLQSHLVLEASSSMWNIFSNSCSGSHWYDINFNIICHYVNIL